MKAKFILFSFFVLYSLCSRAAFNKNESEQLFIINNQAQEKVDEVISELNNIQQIQIKDNPERKVQIDDLRSSWDITIKKRCDLEIAESKGTGAEISAFNDCLAKGYREELDYFSNMLP